jgi:hypothetical protein
MSLNDEVRSLRAIGQARRAMALREFRRRSGNDRPGSDRPGSDRIVSEKPSQGALQSDRRSEDKAAA